MFRRSRLVAWVVLSMLFFIFSTYLLLNRLPSIASVLKPKQDAAVHFSFEEEIILGLESLPAYYKVLPAVAPQENKIQKYIKYVEQTGNFKNLTHLQALWQQAQSWVSNKQLYNTSDARIGEVVNALKHAPITAADLDVRGTQLKFLLTLEGDQQVIFKPKWYDRDEIINGPVYAGKDRYSSEILAFYLSIVLDIPRTSISVARSISLKYEILPVATTRLLNTSYRSRNNLTCVYGQCLYCKREDPICSKDDGMLPGVVIFNVNKLFNIYRSPWQRTYQIGKKAAWEGSGDYCKMVKTKLSPKRLLDLIDTAIFDFLIQNGDRHHYETLDDTVIWLDNGKGLGNPHNIHVDILAPLYQCCMMRRGTLERLLNLRGGKLEMFLKLEPEVNKIVSDLHLKALDERLLIIFSAVEFCKKSNPYIVQNIL